MKTMRSEMKLKINDNSLTDEYYKYYQNMEITSPTSYRPDIDQQNMYNETKINKQKNYTD